MRDQTIRYIALLALTVALLPSSGFSQKKAAAQSNKPAELIWPLPPQKPRIKYLSAFASNLDVEPPKKLKWWQKIINEDLQLRITGLGRPAGIAVDSKDRIYIADTTKKAVFVFDQANKSLSRLGTGSRGGLGAPYGIAIDKNDNIYVSDTGLKQVNVYDPQGNITAAIRKVGNEEIVNPTGLALDEERNRLVIVDSRAHKVRVTYLDRLGEGTSFGKRGTDDEEFNFPGYVAVDKQGRIYVTDTLNFCVKIFDKDFKFLERIGEHGNALGMFDRPKGIALDSEGNIYVVDAAFSNFQIFNQKHQLLLFVGGYGSRPGSFRLPSGIFIDRKDRIYVSDQANSRIQIFQFLGGN